MAASRSDGDSMVPGPPSKQALLLIVGDETDTADSLCAYLENALPGVHVAARTSTAEATRFLERNRVDALLVDHGRPAEDGLAFLEVVHRAKPELPTVLITADRRPEFLRDAINRAHVQGLFLKPFDEHALVAVVERLLKKRRGSAGRIPRSPALRTKDPPSDS